MSLIEALAPAIRALPERSRYVRTELLVPDFHIATEGGLRMYHAPCDATNARARVAIVGITPGWTRMEICFRVARRELLAGVAPAEACRRAKMQASFAGPMRANLIRMLDELGLPGLLGLISSADLFGPAHLLLHTTSAIRYPVFQGDRNYTGSRPHPLKSALLMRTARELLAVEFAQVPEAPIVPLGKSVDAVLAALQREGYLAPGRCLSGFPHPSGANGHRVRQFAEGRAEFRRTIDHILGGFPAAPSPTAA